MPTQIDFTFYDDLQQFFIDANLAVNATGAPNFEVAKILLPSSFNFDFIAQHLKDYHEPLLVEWLKYGFPLGHDRKHGEKSIPKNHTGARYFNLVEALNKEVKTLAAIGPFKNSPFGKETYLSPLNSVPKKESKSRRLILPGRKFH